MFPKPAVSAAILRKQNKYKKKKTQTKFKKKKKRKLQKERPFGNSKETRVGIFRETFAHLETFTDKDAEFNFFFLFLLFDRCYALLLVPFLPILARPVSF